MTNGIPSVSEKIASYYVNANQDDIPDDVMFHAKECVLDYFGCAIGGADLETTKIVKNAMIREEDGGKCAVFNNGKASADKAAFINGVSLHGLEMDDSNTSAGGHPAGPVISAALAVAEESNATGLELLRSIVWGYDMMVRVCRGAIIDSSNERGWHPTAIYGIFGATVAVCYLKKMDAKQISNALGIACGFAAGNLECFADNSFTKRINPGHAAMAAITAARLAECGYIGPRWIFEGDHGFLRMYSDEYYPERMIDNLDYSEYPIMYTAFKPYPSCRFTHSSIDGVLKIKKENDVKADDIGKITIDTVSMAIRAVVEPREKKYNPENIPGAQFSLPYTVACAALFDAVSVEQFTEELLVDKEVKEMMNRVEMIYTKEMDQYLPTMFAAKVIIYTKDGKEFSEVVTFTKGDPELPLTAIELKEKYLSLAKLTMDEQKALTIYDKIQELESISVRELTALI